MQAPDGQHVCGVSTADIDHVLLEQVPGRIAGVATEERQLRGMTPMPRKGPMKTANKVPRITGCRRNKADARSAFFCEAQNVTIQSQIPRLHEESAAAQNHDLPEDRLRRLSTFFATAASIIREACKNRARVHPVQKQVKTTPMASSTTVVNRSTQGFALIGSWLARLPLLRQRLSRTIMLDCH